MRWFNRLAGALLVLALLAAPPLAAAQWIREHPWSWPTTSQLAGWLKQPLTGHAVAAAAIVILSACWLLLAWFVIRRVVRAIGSAARRVRQVQMPTPLQMTAGTVSAAAVAFPTVAVAPAAVDAAAADPAPSANPDGPRDNDRQADAHGGIELPGGGWVPYPTALVVTAVAAMIWLARRRSYSATSLRPGHHHVDNDLRPLPPAADAITAAVTADRPQPPPAPTGPATLDDLPVGRLNLSGPGAADAARGLLATILLHAALNPTDATQITADQHTLHMMLGHDLSEPAPPGLTITSNSNQEPGPELSLTVHRHRSTTTADLPGTAQPSAPLVTTVTIGGPLHAGSCWRVEADGTINHDETISQPVTGQPHRLCVLQAPACSDLLHLAQHATPHLAPPATAPATHPRVPATAGRLRLLGTCELTINGRAIRLRRFASLQILAYLATRPGGATTTELLTALWPGHPPSAITKRLHTTLTDLRQQLHPLLNEPITRRHDHYQLNPDAIATDLDPLRRGITAAAAAITLDQRQNVIDAITHINVTDLAPGYARPWLQPVREQLRRDVIDACLLLAATAHPAQAAVLSHTATTADPHNTDLRHRASALLQNTERTTVDERGHHDPTSPG